MCQNRLWCIWILSAYNEGKCLGVHIGQRAGGKLCRSIPGALFTCVQPPLTLCTSEVLSLLSGASSALKAWLILNQRSPSVTTLALPSLLILISTKDILPQNLLIRKWKNENKVNDPSEIFILSQGHQQATCFHKLSVSFLRSFWSQTLNFYKVIIMGIWGRRNHEGEFVIVAFLLHWCLLP